MKEKVKTITAINSFFNKEDFDTKVESFIRNVKVLAMEYSHSIDMINGVTVTSQSVMIIYEDKEAEQE